MARSPVYIHIHNLFLHLDLFYFVQKPLRGLFDYKTLYLPHQSIPVCELIKLKYAPEELATNQVLLISVIY